MPKYILPVLLSVALLGTAGCGLVGWQGEPPTDPSRTVEGIMLTKTLPEGGSLWVIGADTATYVPESNLPPEIKQDSLSVRATGTVGDPSDVYPDGYSFEISVIEPSE